MGCDVRFSARTNLRLWPVTRLLHDNRAQWGEQQCYIDSLQLLEEHGSKGEASSAGLNDDGAGRAVSGRPRQTNQLSLLLLKLEDNVKDAKVRLMKLRTELMGLETDELAADAEVQEIEGVFAGLGLDINHGYSAWCSSSAVNSII
jgi:hypothetical protein